MHHSDSLPQTPLSPGRGPPSSNNAFWQDSLGSPRGTDIAAAAAAQHWDEAQQQEQQQAPPLQVGALPTVAEGSEAAALRRGLSARGGGDGGAAATPASAYPCISEAGRGAKAILPLLWHLVLPVTVAVLGIACSLSAFLLAVAALRNATSVTP